MDTCRIHDERALRRRYAAKAPGAAKALGPFPLERIVAAGIQHQDVNPAATVADHIHHPIGPNRLRHDERFLTRLGIGDVCWQEIIAAIDLNAVAREKEQRRIALFNPGGKLQQLAVHSSTVQVLGAENFKSEIPERIPDGLGIVHRLLEIGNIFVIIVANDERQPFGLSGPCAAEQQHKRGENKKTCPAHRPSPIESYAPVDL
ncbi:hypothetical protein MnTg02_02196 [bacterium MnTg02]|nr:hypothetical protein MnTg02_02196 [bacterium MnTg02]